jgi:hypothetical protein
VSDDFEALARQRKVIGASGVRPANSLWSVRPLKQAKDDDRRLFKALAPQALGTAIDQARVLALFPDKRPTVDGELLDIKYEKVQGEVYYRLVVDDKEFAIVLLAAREDENYLDTGRSMEARCLRETHACQDSQATTRHRLDRSVGRNMGIGAIHERDITSLIGPGR